MAAFFQQIFNILTTNPGNLIYHLVLAFSVAWALQASLTLRGEDSRGRRMSAGLGLLLLLRLALFIAAGLAWKSLLDAHLLPGLDRAVNLLSLVLIVWLWAFPDRSSLGDTATLLLLGLTLILGIIGIIYWQQSTLNAFNGSILDQIADGYALVLSGIGILILLARRPASWGAGLFMLGTLAVGHAANLAFPLAGSDFPGATRLAEMIAFSQLALLNYLFPLAPKTLLTSQIQPTQVEGSKDIADLQALRTLLALATKTSGNNLQQELSRSLCYLLVADIALLVKTGESNERLMVLTGFNMVKEKLIEPLNLDGPVAVVVNNALRRGRPLRLPSTSTSMDMQAVSVSLGANQLGPLMALPMEPVEANPALGVVLLSPYSNRNWTADDQTRLAAYIETIRGILNQSQQRDALNTEFSQLRSELQSIKPQFEQVQAENKALLSQMESTRQLAETASSRAESLAALIDQQEEYQATIAQLESEIKTLKEEASLPMASPGSDEVKHLEDELQLALEEVAHLKQSISEADQKLLEYQKQTGNASLPLEQGEVIAAISQELRQPMSSIVGYTDLLLGESVGILGALQRKFLDRIKVSTERMNGLLDDLIQTATLQNGKVTISPEAVDLNVAIDEAITATITQMREKNITLRVDLPERLPQITADRDALQQILIHLLQNASSATPEEGEIALSAELQSENSKEDYILVQISDTGGGIPPEDLKRIFSRLYRADNPLIQGVGDTGVGLSIVKTLVEAHNGRIWVDTDPGKGSVFSVLLPVAAPAVRPGILAGGNSR